MKILTRSNTFLFSHKRREDWAALQATWIYHICFNKVREKNKIQFDIQRLLLFFSSLASLVLFFIFSLEHLFSFRCAKNKKQKYLFDKFFSIQNVLHANKLSYFSTYGGKGNALHLSITSKTWIICHASYLLRCKPLISKYLKITVKQIMIM